MILVLCFDHKTTSVFFALVECYPFLDIAKFAILSILGGYMLNLHKEYIDESYNSAGEVENFRLHCPDDFNFAYDVIDRLGTQTPHRRAMRWTDDRGAKFDLTFRDFKDGSDKAASYFRQMGIGKGDRVMLIMRDRKSVV